MSLLANRCDRCGEKTRRLDGDQRICESCHQELALLVAASSETQRLCPTDGEPMAKEIAHSVIIDRCPRCQGVWLDAGELEFIGSSLEEAALRSIVGRFIYPTG
jgi:predicted amidophosphoribosyltransferase